MGKITGLPQALSFDEGDVLVKDGEHGTKQIPVSEAAKYMGRDTIMVNEQPTEGTKVVIQTTGQEYSLALMSDVNAVDDKVDDKVDEVKTHYTNHESDQFAGFTMNPNNIFADYRLENPTLLTQNATKITSFPTNIIDVSNTADSPTVENFSIGIRLEGNTQYYLHMKIRARRNASYAYKQHNCTYMAYASNSLKYNGNIGIPTTPASGWTDWADVSISMNHTQACDELRIRVQFGFDVEFKDIYCVEATDSTPMYKIIMDDTQTEQMIEDETLSESDVISLIEQYAPGAVDNMLKLAIIGDSLSAYDETVDKKYWYYLADKNGFDIGTDHANVVAVSGSGYTNGSIFGGTRNHQFYNQATRIANDTEAVLVFGSFNDMGNINGRARVVNASDGIIQNVSTTRGTSGTQLSVDSTTTHYITHNAESEIAAGTYYMTSGGVNYQFTTTSACPSGGKIQIYLVQYGEIGTDDNDTDTIVGAFTAMINNLYTINPGMIIGVVAPTPWRGYCPSNTTGGAEAAELYVSKQKELCEYYSIPFLPLYYESNLRPWDATFRTNYYNEADGTHPNNDGHELFVYPKMREFLRTINPKYIQ